MATFDAIPDAPVFDAVPDAPEFDATPDDAPEINVPEARRVAAGALQAIDVMAAPFRLDWSEANEHLDTQRFQESETALARAQAAEEQGSGTGPGSEAFNWRREAEFQRGRISPDTSVGRTLAQQGETQLQNIQEEGVTDARNAVPTSTELLRSFLGSGITQTAEPILDSAARNIGPAAGGALGAALATAATVGTGGVAPLVLGVGMSMLGGFAGGAAQEGILETTETEEETQQRQQRAAQDFARNPGLSRIGAMAAGAPFFGPSMAQFGRAATGDRGAMFNLMAAGGIGAGAEIAAAKFTRGEEVKPEDVAAAFFSNMIMNEPTKLGRRLGLRPSSEQQAIEDAQTKYEGGVPRIGDERPSIELGLENRGTTSTADVFAGVQRAPEGAPPIQTQPEIIGTAINMPEGELIRGEAWNAPHPTMIMSALERGVPENQIEANLGFAIREPDGTERFATREEAAQIAKDQGLLPPDAPAKLTSEQLQGLPEPGGIKAAPEVAEPTVTSIKNAQVDAERAQRGLPPMDEVVPVSDREFWERAKAIEEADPRAADRLIETISEKPRGLSPEETMLLLRKRTQLSSGFRKAEDAVVAAQKSGDPTALESAKMDRNAASEALTKLEQATGRGGAGTEQGRAFRLRQLLMREDFSLERMTTRLSAEQDGVSLSEAQEAQVRKQADTIAKTQAEMDRILAEREVLKAQAEADKTVDPKVKSLADRIVARLDLTAKNAATSLRSRLNNLGSAPDPLIVLDVAKIAAAKTAKGAIEFAQWSAEMIKEFGEKVRPFLQAGWDQREQHIDSEIGTTTSKGKKTKTDAEKEQTAVKARLTSLANRTAEYQRRTGKSDFSPMRKPAMDLSKNPEWVKLKAENDTAKAAYEKSRYEARKSQRTTQQKINDTVADVFSAARPILASTDISAPGRQGIFFTLPDLFMNPVRLGRQLKAMFRSQFSETKFQQNEAAIKSRENAGLYESSDLYLADIDHKPSAREEQFKSELAEKIPGIGRVVRGSSRGFSAFMNTVRADAMDAFVKWSGGKENLDPETAKYLAAAINDLSGRGNVSNRQAQGALEWLAKYLFSPRLWVSRFNTALLKPIWRDPLNTAISPRARAVVAGQYVKFAGALLALKWLAGLNGGKMEEDPRDSDFGKLQFGTKRYDVMGGIGNMTTLLSRIATQKTKDDKGKLVRIAWSGEKRPERELGQILFNHLRNKAAPIPGAVYDYIYGRHPDRSKVTPTSMLKQTTVPITVSDTMEYFKTDSPASAARDTLINALGVSVQDYRK